MRREPCRLSWQKRSLSRTAQEIEKQLTKNKMVKAKILKSALSEHETKEVATTIAEQTSATLVEVRGHTFILYKPRNK